MIIILASALVAALSFAGFAMPYLRQQEKKERTRNIIEKKRKTLFESVKAGNDRHDDKSLTARESVALFFKVKIMFGDYGEKLRDQMLQAGIRDPKAPFMYLAAQIGLPVFLILFTLLIMLGGQKEFSQAAVMFACLGMGAFGFMLPRILVKNHILKRQQEINITFPDALDMMLVCVQGGIGLEQTILRVSEEVAEHAPTLAEELGILSAEMGMLNDRRAALQDFARRVGSGAAKSFATALIQAEQYGTSVSSVIRTIADELRDMRMAEAERKAAALPPKLTVPMILFFLPALFVVILGPAILQATQAQ
ncbi:MAG: type II secretion system F family protein [Alphaproteobacteria bacterium]|nr:type II secretion system F family protein [Alphaproteobacteria bacterium]